MRMWSQKFLNTEITLQYIYNIDIEVVLEGPFIFFNNAPTFSLYKFCTFENQGALSLKVCFPVKIFPNQKSSEPKKIVRAFYNWN